MSNSSSPEPILDAVTRLIAFLRSLEGEDSQRGLHAAQNFEHTLTLLRSPADFAQGVAQLGSDISGKGILDWTWTDEHRKQIEQFSDEISGLLYPASGTLPPDGSLLPTLVNEKEARMPQRELLRNLQRFSTWLLLILGMFTYGVYFAHYCARQSRIINEVLELDREIPEGLVNSIFVVSYGSLALFLGCLFVDDRHPIALLSSVADLVWTILLLVWGFYARSRMNEISGVVRGAPAWFHGLWTFMFTPLYFNYKVNVLNEASASADAAA